MKNSPLSYLLIAVAAVLSSAPAFAQEEFLGRWALTIPGGGAGWLGVTQEKGYLDSSVLWGGGSVVPTSSTYIDGDTLYVTRTHSQQRKGADGKTVRRHTITETITATIDGDSMKLVTSRPRNDGKGVVRRAFSGNRIPALPARPNLSKAKYGKAQNLLAKDGLSGWKLINDRQANGWSVTDGVLLNDAHEKGKSFGNLRTVAEFEDFNLKIGVNVPKGNNSGVYLRGIYEIQVLDSYGKKLDSHNMGALYSRITPSQAAEKPADEWQEMDITLWQRHLTVKLNGKTIIDNEPVLGCTGGAMWSDEFKPGPIFLQGDHGTVRFKDIVLTPILN